MGEAILTRAGAIYNENTPKMSWKLYTEVIDANTTYTVPTCKNQQLTVMCFGGGGGYYNNNVSGGGGGGGGGIGSRGSNSNSSSGGGGGGYGHYTNNTGGGGYGNFGYGAGGYGSTSDNINSSYSSEKMVFVQFNTTI